jgi:Ca2+/Na+ antiporter
VNLVRRVAIVLFYLLIALLALDALIANFTTAMPGIVKLQASNEIQPSEFDIFFWNLWWVRHAIFDLHVSPLYTNFVVYPFVSPLAGHTLALLWGLLSAPFQPFFGLIPTFNGIVVLSFVLAGVSMYAFTRKHVQRTSVALLAGLIFAFTPAMMQRASVGHLDKLSVFWLPLCLLLWDKVIETKRWTWSVITGLCLYLSWLTDFQQTMWTLLLWGPYVLYTILSLKRRRERGDVSEAFGFAAPLRLAVVALVAFVIPALFAPLPQLLEANKLNYPLVRLEDTAYFAFPLQNLFTRNDNGDFTIGLLLPLLALISILFIRRDGERWFWLILAIGCFILALGPYVEIGGTRIDLPYALLHRLLGNQYRTPMRFMTPAVLALTMVVCLTLDRTVFRWKWLLDRVNAQHILVAGLMLLFVWDYDLLKPFPITVMPDYQAYRAIAQEPGDFTVLELPIGVRTGFAIVGRGEALQYYEPFHQHAAPTGYLSRLPNEVLDFFYSDPLLGALTLSHGLPPQAEVDAQLSQLIRDWNIGYVILHRDLLEQGRIKSFGDLLNRQPLLEKVGEEGPLVIYKAQGK